MKENLRYSLGFFVFALLCWIAFCEFGYDERNSGFAAYFFLFFFLSLMAALINIDKAIQKFKKNFKNRPN